MVLYQGIELPDEHPPAPEGPDKTPFIVGGVVAVLVVAVAVFMMRGPNEEEVKKLQQEEAVEFVKKHPHLRKFYFPEE